MITYRMALSRAARAFGAVLLMVLFGTGSASASTLSQRDVQIMAKAVGFLEPPPTGSAIVAIAYDQSDPDSKQDADSIAAYFGDGLRAGNAMLRPKVIEVGQLSSGGFIAVIAASGAKIDQVSSAAQALHIACITADTAAVQAGQCVMSVKSRPKVDIQINRAAAATSGVTFGSAFLLMAHAI